MNGSRGSLARAAGVGCASVALALVGACASRAPAATSADGSGRTAGPSSAILNGPTPSASRSPSSLAAPPPTPTPTLGRTPTATAGAPISCTATVSNPTPKNGMPTHVVVQTASGAQVSVVATSAADASALMPKQTLRADVDGRVDLTIAAPVAGTGPFKVAVRVNASKAGATALCATTFTSVDLPQPTGSPGLPPIQVTTQPIPPANADA